MTLNLTIEQASILLMALDHLTFKGRPTAEVKKLAVEVREFIDSKMENESKVEVAA